MSVVGMPFKVAQVQQSPVSPSPGLQSPIQPSQGLNPLINRSGEDVIYIGVGLLAIAVILTIGFFNQKLEYAIIFSLIIAVVMILLVVLA